MWLCRLTLIVTSVASRHLQQISGGNYQPLALHNSRHESRLCFFLFIIIFSFSSRLSRLLITETSEHVSYSRHIANSLFACLNNTT
jgi:hypothetical protein